MDPTTVIGSANSWAGAFTQFVTSHPMAVAVVLAYGISWGATSLLASLLRWFLPDAIERAVIRLVDALAAFFVALYNWPTEPAVWWALLIGVSSPFGYAAFSEALCWKFPRLKPYLSLRELSEPEHVYTPTKPEDLA